MTDIELLSIAALTLMLILFVAMIVGVRRKILLYILVNGLCGMLIYYVLILTEHLSMSRLHPLGVGMLGLLYLISLIFV